MIEEIFKIWNSYTFKERLKELQKNEKKLLDDLINSEVIKILCDLVFYTTH